MYAIRRKYIWDLFQKKYRIFNNNNNNANITFTFEMFNFGMLLEL